MFQSNVLYNEHLQLISNEGPIFVKRSPHKVYQERKELIEGYRFGYPKPCPLIFLLL